MTSPFNMWLRKFTDDFCNGPIPAYVTSILRGGKVRRATDQKVRSLTLQSGQSAAEMSTRWLNILVPSHPFISLQARLGSTQELRATFNLALLQ